MDAKRSGSVSDHRRRTIILLLLGGLFLGLRAWAVGNWTTLASVPSGSQGLARMLLLSDGTVMAQEVGTSSAWYRLTPDAHGSYINGTWSTLRPMNYTRQFYSSAVLQDGRVFVAGGEFGTGGSTAEIYDPTTDTWTEIPVPINVLCPSCGSPFFVDSCSVVLSNGNVLIAPVAMNGVGGTVIFNPTSNTFSLGPSFLGSQNEACWVKLPDDSILTIDATNDGNLLNSSERFIPSLYNGLGGWVADAQLPVAMYNTHIETGAGVLLSDGRVFFIGGNGATVYYTPSGNTSPGTWAIGPHLTNYAVGWDEPVAMLVNGKVLFQTQLGPDVTPPAPQPRTFFELDPFSNYPIGTITEAPRWGDNSGVSHIMLNLPDGNGNVLVSYGNTTIRVYQPDGSPVAAGKPSINSITPNPDGSYHLTGTKLNGISQGSSFGDDAQMDSNYPLVRLSDASGNVYFGRTYNWSSTSVATGNRVVSTEFTLPGLLGPAPYSLVVVANGISSDPVSFPGPVWVDFNYLGFFQVGSFFFPYSTMGNGVANGLPYGAMFIKGPASSPETMIITKPMNISAVGGPVTIGH